MINLLVPLRHFWRWKQTLQDPRGMGKSSYADNSMTVDALEQLFNLLCGNS